ARSSVTATSSLILGRKSTTYSAPRYSSVWPFWRPKPLTSVTVMPATPASASASRTSSSLNGLMIAITIFIDRVPRCGCGQHNAGKRPGEHPACRLRRRTPSGFSYATPRTFPMAPARSLRQAAGTTQEHPMIDLNHIDDLARRLSGLVPPSMREGREELQQNFKAVLQTGLSRLDLVTREEFDVQRA